MIDDVVNAISFILGALAALCGVAALVIYASTKLAQESQTGVADGRMIACVGAAVAFAAAAILIRNIDLNYEYGG